MLHIHGFDMGKWSHLWEGNVFCLYSDMLGISALAQAPVLLHRVSSSQVSMSIISWKRCSVWHMLCNGFSSGCGDLCKMCAADTSEKRVRMRDHHAPSCMVSLIFINAIPQQWQPLFLSIAHSEQTWSWKQCSTLNSAVLTCPLPSPDPESLHTLCCLSGSQPFWKRDGDQPLQTCFLMAAELQVLIMQMPSVSSPQQFPTCTGQWSSASKQGLGIKSPTWQCAGS